jgi:hypothetical protein
MEREYQNIGEWLKDKGTPPAAVEGNSVAVLETVSGYTQITVYHFTESVNPFSGETLLNLQNGWGIHPDHFGSLKKLLNSMEARA